MDTKIIHYVWIGGNKFPKLFRNYMKTWSKLNPGYTVKGWFNDEADELMKNSILKEFYFNSDKVGFKSDLLRYQILQSYGGVYVDTDLECKRPIDVLVNKSDFVYADQSPCSPAIGFLASKKNGKFITFLIEILKTSLLYKEYSSNNFNATLEKSGPEFLNHVVRLWFGSGKFYPYHDHLGDHVGNHCRGITALYEYVIYPYFPHLGTYAYDPIKNARAYTIHHWAGSWI